MDQAESVQQVLNNIVDTARSFDTNMSTEAIAQLKAEIEASSGTNRDTVVAVLDTLSSVLNDVDTKYVATIQNVAGTVNLGGTIDDIRKYETIR